MDCRSEAKLVKDVGNFCVHRSEANVNNNVKQIECFVMRNHEMIIKSHYCYIKATASIQIFLFKLAPFLHCVRFCNSLGVTLCRSCIHW